MSLAAGARLGPYEIVAPLGAGGMGEVYRARDTRLRREVAIKVLPDAFASDAQRLGRFEREAQLLASLSHPNIAAIHGFDEAGGVHFLVLELVAGETLAERLAEGPLELEEAFNVARQIAEGLEAAHERGVIHRDLKPSNVKITPEGKVKVLDFGLAKALGAESAAHDLSQSPTVTTGATRDGVILGTAAYMSPEQARGKPLEKRTDVWSFGCVLYETLTGRQAFSGETVSDTLVAILGREPDWQALPATTPARIRDLLRRCLQKDPTRRLRDIGDARIEIEEALAEPAADAAAAATQVRAAPYPLGRLGLPLAFAAAMGLVAGVLVTRISRRALAMPPRAVSRFAVALPPGQRLADSSYPEVALSPTGRHLVYAASSEGRTQLFLRAMDQLEATPISGTEGASSPFFSPDGQWVGFFASGKLKKISFSGGEASVLCDATSPQGMTWAPDDTIVFSPQSYSSLLRVPAAGGAPEVLTKPDFRGGEGSHWWFRWPQVLPGGKVILFTAHAGAGTPDKSLIEVHSLVTGERKVVVRGGTSARYVPTGHLVYALAGRLMAVPFDLARLEVTGPAVVLLEDLLVDPASGAAQFGLSDGGSLAYVAGSPSNRRLVWVDHNGMAEPLAAPPRPYVHPRLSPDGKRVAVTITGETYDVWLYDIPRDTLTRLTYEADNNYPIWTPDGKRVTFQSNRDGSPNLYWTNADGSDTPERLTRSEYTQITESWSPDGRTLLFIELRPTTAWDVWVLPLQGERKPRPLVQTSFVDGTPQISPDGRWVAYWSNETGRREIYVRPFPGPGGKWQISTEGGWQAAWRKDGRELFYRNGDKMMAVAITSREEFSATRPALLFEKHYEQIQGKNYDVSADGRRFLMVQGEPETASRIHIVLNWFDELKRRVPTEKK